MTPIVEFDYKRLMTAVENDGLNDFKNTSIEDVYKLSNNKKYVKLNKPKEEYDRYKQLVHQARSSKLPFRIIDLVKKSFKQGPSLPANVRDKLPYPLQRIPSNKQQRNASLSEYESSLLNTIPHQILEIASQIHWLHGTNSAILPFMPGTNYTLIPAGSLLSEFGIAPMSGELQDGLSYIGVSQHYISGETITSLSRCRDYAENISFSFKPEDYKDVEKFFGDEISRLEELKVNDTHWDRSIIALYRLKQWNPQEFQRLCEIHHDRILSLQAKYNEAHSWHETRFLKLLHYDSQRLQEALRDEKVKKEVEAEFPELTEPGRSEYNWNYPDFVSLEQFLEIEAFNGALFQQMYPTLINQLLNVKLYSQASVDRSIKSAENGSILGKRRLSILQWYLEDKDPKGYEDVKADKILQKVFVPIMENRMRYNALPFKARMQRFEKLFFSPPAIVFSEEDRSHVQRPFPLLLGSTHPNGIQNSRELNVKQAKFGKEIDLVFVPEPHVEKMRSWLQNHQLSHVKVYSFSAIDEMTKMPLYPPSKQITLNTKYLSEEEALRLNKSIKEHVIPLYRQPYPDGTDRKVHGVPHALRVFIHAQVIASMYKDAGITGKKKKNDFLLASPLHDCARKNDGVDLWDKESGAKTNAVLKTLGSNSEDCEFFEKAIAEKDDKSPKSLEQKNIHDADCIEIMRVLDDEKEFRPSELWMMKDLDQDLAHSFIAEASLFIKLTDKNEKIKAFIEQSPDPLSCLLQILNYANTYNGKFELFCHHVQTSNFFIPGNYILTEEVEKEIVAQISQTSVETKPVAAKTRVLARCDVKFGNKLFIRGEGIPNLNWKKGIEMTCVQGPDLWAVEFDSADLSGLQFKFLVNDDERFWEKGGNHRFASGKSEEEFKANFYERSSI